MARSAQVESAATAPTALVLNEGLFSLIVGLRRTCFGACLSDEGRRFSGVGMTGMCRVPACGRPATRYGRYCTTHKSRLRRHGHVAQNGVTKAALRPYIARVRARVAKNQGNPTWVACDNRWLAIVDHAQEILNARRSGSPGNVSEGAAASLLVKLSANVEPRHIVEVVLAMYLMQDMEPHIFRSDEAFRIQLVRRVMRLNGVSASEGFDLQTGRVRRAYRDFTPKAASLIARWLIDALGSTGLHLAKLELRDAQKVQKERTDFQIGLADLE